MELRQIENEERMRLRQIENEEYLRVLMVLFVSGAVIAGMGVLTCFGQYGEAGNMVRAYSIIFILWTGLIWAGAHLAVKKGRELVEGAVLGALGPLGIIIEVLLPPSKTLEQLQNRRQLKLWIFSGFCTYSCDRPKLQWDNGLLLQLREMDSWIRYGIDTLRGG